MTDPEEDAEELTFAYDAAGNLVSQQRLVPNGSGGAARIEWQYVYDAWNRLVEVRIDPTDTLLNPPQDPEPLQIRARYGYNGLHWRAWRIADEDLDVDSLPDVSNLYYYDAMWRLLEEHARGRFDVSDDDDWGVVQPDSGDLVRITQRVWNLHYIDDLVACGRPAIANQGLAMARKARG